MPKKTKDFPEQLLFMVPRQMKIELIALGYLTGGGKSYAAVARNLLTQAISTAVAKLDPDRRKAYDEILANVKVMEAPAPE